MTNQYRAVSWNTHKKVYDLILWLCIVLMFGVFMLVGKLAWIGDRSISDEILIIRALGITAMVLLHVILCIGPLARLDPRFNVLLYNRRHLGLSMFLVALLHATLIAAYYGAFGNANPIQAILGVGSVTSLAAFPFERLGLLALLILFLMAATSHDFWLKNLSPRVWKSLHMGVYLAYALLVMHVALGVLQSERSPMPAIALGIGLLLVVSLHVTAAVQGRKKDHGATREHDGWLDAGLADEITMDRAVGLDLPNGDRVAVFRYRDERGEAFSAISGVCAHQMGPLTEAKVVNGCVTCPWHGYQYRPADGRSPPPYTEKLGTYRVQIEHGRVLVHPVALDPGTPIEPARRNEADDA